MYDAWLNGYGEIWGNVSAIESAKDTRCKFNDFFKLGSLYAGYFPAEG